MNKKKKLLKKYLKALEKKRVTDAKFHKALNKYFPRTCNKATKYKGSA